MDISIEVIIEQSDMPPLRLEESIYYYLQPMFEQINNHTGRYVTLNKDCVFPVDNLSVLQKYVFEKKHTVRQLKPVMINFISGTTTTKSKNGKILKKNNVMEINKQELLFFLTQVSTFIDLARQSSCELKFRCV